MRNLKLGVCAFSMMCMFLFYSCSSSFMVVQNPSVMPPPRKIEMKPRVALVLGGGAFHGLAHLGVLKAFEEENIKIDLIIGTSAGSFAGALYADNPDIDNILSYAMGIKISEVFDFSYFRSATGFVSGELLQNYINSHIKNKRIENFPIPFIAVTTNLKKGESVYISSGPVAPAVNASCAIPEIFEPVMMYGMLCVDGGVLNNVATDVAKSYDAEIIIAVDIMADFNTDPDISNFIDVLTRSYQVSAHYLKNEKLKLADIVISPDLEGMPLLSDTQNKPMYDAGYKAAKEKISEIKKLLAKSDQDN